MSDKQDDILYRYKGPAKFYGIPARDLTAADVERLDLNQRRDVIASDAYQEQDTKAKPDSKPAADTTKKGEG